MSRLFIIKAWTLGYSVLLLLMIACQNEVMNHCLPPNCVQETAISDTSTYIWVHEYVEKRFGLAQAIKINKIDTFLIYYIPPLSDSLPFGSIGLASYQFKSWPIESIRINKIPIQTGCVDLNDSEYRQHIEYLTKDGDLTFNHYKLDTTVVNTFEISHIDELENEICGFFDFTFIHNPAKGKYFNDGSPKKIRFFNGRFKAPTFK